MSIALIPSPVLSVQARRQCDNLRLTMTHSSRGSTLVKPHSPMSSPQRLATRITVRSYASCNGRYRACRTASTQMDAPQSLRHEEQQEILSYGAAILICKPPVSKNWFIIFTPKLFRDNFPSNSVTPPSWSSERGRPRDRPSKALSSFYSTIGVIWWPPRPL